MANDIIEVVEKAYSLTGSEHEWLQGLATAARPLVDRGLGVLAFTYRARAGHALRIPTAVGAGVSEALMKTVVPFNLAAPPEMVAHTYLARTGCTSASEVSGQGAKLDEHPAWRTFLHPQGMHDYSATNVLVDPRGYGCILGAPLPRVQRTPVAIRRAWDRVAAHIAAGMRLRAELGSQSPLEGADAIMTPAGRVEHAAVDAQPSDARELLRLAAASIDKARGRLRRSDPGQALELWQGLVSGRWSLVEHFERDGRRYLVARRNDPGVTDPRALSLRERQVAWYTSLGHSNKIIGYELGVSLSSVATHLKQAAAKLGVRSRPELVALVRGLLTSEDSLSQ